MDWATDERFSTYKQYKEDTEAIAGWLAYNSRRCGYPLDGPLAAGPSNTPSTRLKGNARKQARVAGSKPTTTKTLLKPEYAINVSDFNRMAKAIADFKPKVAIPTALDNLFNRAINARRQFTEWYQQSSHGDEGSNERHAHFTGVLTSAWEILCPFEQARTSRVKKRPADVPKPDPAANLANRFSKLEVERSEGGLDAETGTSTRQDEDDYKLTDVAPVTIVKSEEDIEEDFFFAIFTFMQDLDELRTYIRQIWLGYQKGILELMVSSLHTNTAIQLVRRAEHELDLMIQRPKKYPASRYSVWNFPDIFIYALHEEGLKSKGRDLDSFLKPSAGFDIFDCGHADLCLSETFCALKHSLYKFRARGGRYVFLGNVPHHERVTETFERIKDMLPCFQATAQAIGESFASDEITSGIGLMFDSQTIPIWVAFAVQSLIDIQDALKAVPKKAVQEVQQHTREKLTRFRGMNFNQEPSTMVGEGIQWLAATLGGYELAVLGDHFRKMITGGDLIDPSGRRIPLSRSLDAARDQSGLHEFLYEPDYFLRINPVKCGMLKYGLYLQPHNYAADLEASWRSITSMVHLYMACRSVFPDDPVWPDMEYFLERQDLANLFVGGLPGSMEEAYKKVLLASGVTAVNFARNRRSTAPSVNMDKRRCVSNPCLLDDVFSTWMCGGKVMTDDMILNLVKVITDPKSNAVMARNAGIRPEYASMLNDARETADHGKNTILGKLVAHVIAETNDLYFDWLSFMETCQNIWAQIYIALNELDGKKTKSSPVMLVIDMLDEARKCERMAEVDKVDAKSVMREIGIGLVQSWEIIQKVNRQALKISPETGADIRSGMKIWGGDKELFNVVDKLGESAYPNLSTLTLQKVYKNWPKEDFNSSVTVFTNCAEWAVEAQQLIGWTPF
ncbi:hypothetical protein F4818DRAFT_423539 [Hypoxylon cercidicola]|nr:hypothetical protein F4818DRAFT_423539 [Hypoxylon cercidicola]